MGGSGGLSWGMQERVKYGKSMQLFHSAVPYDPEPSNQAGEAKEPPNANHSFLAHGASNTIYAGINIIAIDWARQGQEEELRL